MNSLWFGRYFDVIIRFSYINCIFFCLNSFPLILGELILDWEEICSVEFWVYIFDVLYEIYGDMFDDNDWIEYFVFLILFTYILDLCFKYEGYVVNFIYVELYFLRDFFSSYWFLIFPYIFLIDFIYYKFYKKSYFN